MRMLTILLVLLVAGCKVGLAPPVSKKESQPLWIVESNGGVKLPEEVENQTTSERLKTKPKETR